MSVTAEGTRNNIKTDIFVSPTKLFSPVFHKMFFHTSNLKGEYVYPLGTGLWSKNSKLMNVSYFVFKLKKVKFGFDSKNNIDTLFEKSFAF